MMDFREKMQFTECLKTWCEINGFAKGVGKIRIIYKHRILENMHFRKILRPIGDDVWQFS